MGKPEPQTGPEVESGVSYDIAALTESTEVRLWKTQQSDDAREAFVALRRLIEMGTSLDKAQIEQGVHLLERTREVVERLSQSEEAQDAERHEKVLEAYFAADRVLNEARAALAPAEERERPTKPDKADQQKKMPAQHYSAQRQRRRRQMMLITFAAIAAGGRIALLVLEEAAENKAPTVEQKKDGVGSYAKIKNSGKLAADHNRGVPIVTHLRMFREYHGDLRAVGVALDHDGPAPPITYSWYRDGELVKADEHGRLPTPELKLPGNYHVKATATDGKNVSEPLLTSPALIKPQQKKK